MNLLKRLIVAAVVIAFLCVILFYGLLVAGSNEFYPYIRFFRRYIPFILVVLVLDVIVFIILTIAFIIKSGAYKTMVLFSSFVFFLVCWFIPIDWGRCGELPVTKFRFQVWEYDVHSYGREKLHKMLLEPDVSKLSKYGNYDFYDKLGGAGEYFGFKKIRCSHSKNPPTPSGY